MQRPTNYEDWIIALEKRIEAKYGIGIDDLPDCNTADWYDEGMTVAEAFNLVIEINS